MLEVSPPATDMFIATSRGIAMKKLIVGCLCCLFTVISTSTDAEAKVKGKIAVGEAWGMSWDTKGNKAYGTPATTLSVGITAPILDSGFSWSTDIMMSVPNTTFQPSPRLTIGVSYFWKEVKMGLGLSVMEQINPPYEKAKLTNMFGVTASVFVAVTETISIGIGVGYRLTTDMKGLVLKHGLAVGPTVGVTLPW